MSSFFRFFIERHTFALVLTFMFIVPIHNSLSKKHNEKMVGKMIKLNGLRTFFWSLKYLIVGF